MRFLSVIRSDRSSKTWIFNVMMNVMINAVSIRSSKFFKLDAIFIEKTGHTTPTPRLKETWL